MFVGDIIAKIVQHHVAVKHSYVAFKAFLRKAVIVIPRLHLCYHCLNIRVGGQLSCLFVISEHLTHVFAGEFEHLVEFGCHRHVPADVEPTFQVIGSNGTYSCEEDTLEHSLELLEHLAVESRGMGHIVIYRLPMLAEYYVGKVVILVNDEIQWLYFLDILSSKLSFCP